MAIQLTELERKTLELMDWHAHAAHLLLDHRPIDISRRHVLLEANAARAPRRGVFERSRGLAGRYLVRGSGEYAIWMFGIAVRGYLLPRSVLDGVDGYLLRLFISDNRKLVAPLYGNVGNACHRTIGVLLEHGILVRHPDAGPHQLVYRPALADWSGSEWRDRRAT